MWNYIIDLSAFYLFRHFLRLGPYVLGQNSEVAVKNDAWFYGIVCTAYIQNYVLQCIVNGGCETCGIALFQNLGISVKEAFCVVLDRQEYAEEQMPASVRSRP